MAYEGNSGIQVANQYGPRVTGQSAGVSTSKDGIQTLKFEITSKGITDGSNFVGPFVTPKYAKMLRAWVTVDRVLTGVTALNIGEGDAPATNGLALVAADLVVGTRDVTAKLAGTWATASTTGTTRGAKVAVATTGAPTTADGLATVTIEYLYNRRNDNDWAPDKATFPVYKAQPV